MNSGKLKLIIIFIFLAVNLFFVFRLAELYKAKNLFTDEEISQAVQVLETKGISIDPETVMREKTVPNTLQIDFDLTAVEAVAKNLMRKEYGSFKIPDGQRFANDTESFSILYDYTFEYRLFEFEQNAEEITEKLNTAGPATDKEIKALQKQIKALFNSAEDYNYELEFNIKSCVSENGYTYVKAVECINGFEVQSAEIYAVLCDKKAVFLNGRLYFSNTVDSYASDYLDSINILFGVDKTMGTITKMELVYYPVSDKSGSYYLAPGYRFSYSDSATQIYDATSGIRR